MKTPLLLLASCLLLLVAAVVSTPVDTSNLETARQGAGGGNAPAASTDDDDDDDDDDDIDLDITDDDDDDDDDDEDDDAEDDDDDDEDFFERFFEDILGDDDDDDDDDDTPSKPVATPASPVAAATQQRPIAPVSASVDYPSLDYNTAPGETADTADPSAAPLAAYDDALPEEQAAGLASDNVADSAAALDAGTPDLGQKPSDGAAAASTDDDEDDDDDDDDEELDVTLDDDDDDDDDEDDEEDDDDDDDDDDDEDDLSDVVGDDVIEAKRSRALDNNPTTSMYITKYNRFVDNILERINRILRKNYDPVNVRLHTNNEKKGNGKNNGHKKNKNRRRRPGRRPHHTSPVARATTEMVEATMNESLAAISAQLTEALQQTTIQDMNDTITTTMIPTTKRSSGGDSRARPQNNKNKKNKNTPGRNKPNAKATLYGLSTMRREGDVTVNMMSSHTTVRTKFTVGPLILRVEKEFGRGAKKDIRSATATTTEMVGKMNLRVMHGGAATLHSIRVMQPKQVRVESSDDHDKTREYVWKRSSHIARVVSQKLTNATKSMLQPPPMPTNGVFA